MGREIAKPLDEQSKMLSAEARQLTKQMAPGEVTNIEARKLGRQLAKPYEQEAKGFARAAVGVGETGQKRLNQNRDSLLLQRLLESPGEMLLP